MKRFATAAVAAVTALSLFTAPATADDFDFGDLATVIDAGTAAENGISEPHKGSLELSSKASSENTDPERAASAVETYLDVYGSAIENDADKDYKFGTTADILWGVGIAAALIGGVVAALQAGMIPGIALPF